MRPRHHPGAPDDPHDPDDPDRVDAPDGPAPLDRALRAMAWGRITWGVAAYLAPRANARAAGAGDRVTPEVVYLTRVFGSRALALGVGDLAGGAGARPLWRRLSLVVDVADTAAGIIHLVRGDVPRRAAAGLSLVTGTYAAIGAVAASRSGRSRPRVPD